MPYPRKLLNDNETLTLDLHPHWWFFARQILTGAPLLLVLVTWAVLNDGNFRSFIGYVLAILAGLWAAWLAIHYLSWRRTHFVVTNKRVIFRKGVVARSGVEIPISRIMNINFQQRVFERIIRVGNLEVQSAGQQGTSTFNFVRRPDDVQRIIYQEIDSEQDRQFDRRMETFVHTMDERNPSNRIPLPPQDESSSGEAKHEDTATGDTSSDELRGGVSASQGQVADTNTTESEVFNKLSELTKLKDANLISQEEFETKKKELLDRL